MNNQQYPLPEGWEWKPLSSLASIVSGGTPSREVPGFWEPPLHAWVTPTDITGKSGRFLFDAKERISDVGLSNSSATMLPIGTILMTSRATLGEAKIARIPCCTNQGFKSLVPKSDVPSEYLYYLLQFFKEEYKKLGIGSTFLEVNKKDTEQFQLPVAPPSLRPRIANILCELDDHIDTTLELIGKYEVTKQGLMADLFSRGIDPATGLLRPSVHDAPDLYQETPLGLLPKGWSVVELEKLLADVVAPMRSGPFGSALLKEELVDEGIPLLGIDNIFVEQFKPEYRRFVTPEKFHELSRYAVRAGDVVITIMGTVGRTCVIPDNIGVALSSKHLWTMTFDTQQILPDLVCWQLNYSSWAESWFRRESQGGVMEAIQSQTLKRLKLVVPVPEEQEKLKEIYLNLNSRLDSEREQLAKLKLEKAGLMRDLLTGKVPVSA